MYIKSKVCQAYSRFRHFSHTYQPKHHYHTSKATVVDAKYFLPDKQSGWRGTLSRYEYAKRYLMDNVFKRITNYWFGDLPNKTYKLIFRTYHPNNYYFKPRSNILSKNHTTATEPRFFLPTPKNPKFNSIQVKYEQTRRLLINNLLRGVTNSLAADLRRRSERQLFNGNPRPFFALVGVSLASGSGIITKEDEFKSICWEIRESINRMRKNMYDEEIRKVDDKLSLATLEFGSVIAKGSNAVVYEARKKSEAGSSTSYGTDEFPLAVKMMFNYDAESNAIAILRSMYREMVPLQIISSDSSTSNFWEKEMSDRIRRLPPHMNLVKMYRSFTDYVPDLPDSRSLYPDALPYRLNPHGFGRNMSLFIVMKKYKTDLKKYLVDTTPKIKEGILLLTQLLEAVTHFNKYEIAHRDLKSDNILLDFSDYADDCPLLVVTDFGCCLSDKHNGLTMPYKTPDIDRGGNAALMAPEVITAQAGMFSSIDYSKADIWTIGTIAYEIFTKRNPFYRYKNQTENEVLRNTTYTDDMLPELPTEVPAVISRLIHALLAKNPSKRLDAELAATICQLHLWAPSFWFTKQQLPSNNEILQWLLSLTTKVLYEGPAQFRQSKNKPTSKIEFHLIATFLQRVNFGIVKRALNWIHGV